MRRLLSKFGITFKEDSKKQIGKALKRPWDDVGAEYALISTFESAIERLAGVSKWEAFRDVLHKDGRINAKLFTRRAGVFAVPRMFQVAEGADRAEEKKEFIEKLFEHSRFSPKLFKFMNAALYSVAYGLSAIEIFWEEDEKKRIIPADFQLIPNDFLVNTDGVWKYKPEEETSNEEALKIPDKKVIFTTKDPEYGVFGHGLLVELYWLHYIKKNILRYWSLYAEKFGSPTVKIEYPGDPSDEVIAKYLRIAESVQENTAIAIPEGVAISLLEAVRQSQSDYHLFINYLNGEIVQCILGQNLTTESPQQGTYAQAIVHEGVKWDIIRSDCFLIQDTIQQLINWIIEFEYGTQEGAPIFSFDLREPQDDIQKARLYEVLNNMGYRFSEEFISAAFGIPLVKEGQRVIGEIVEEEKNNEGLDNEGEMM